MLKALLTAAVLAASPLHAATFELDPGHTEIRFIWNHAGVSEQSGKWGDVSGTVVFDREKPETISANVSIDAASAITGVPQLDKHLASASFFKPKSHPKITFVSDGFTQTGAKTGVMTGQLTIVGEARPVTLDVELTHEGEHPLGQRIKFFRGNWLGIKATADLKRSDWGLDFLSPFLSDDIRLEIHAEMREGGW